MSRLIYNVVTALIIIGFGWKMMQDERVHEKEIAFMQSQVVKADSITFAVRDSLLTEIMIKDSTISDLKKKPNNDRYKVKYDSLHKIAVRNNYKLERLKYYVAICEKTPSNKTFFYGWVKNRVLMK